MYTFTKLHDVGVRVGPVEFQLYGARRVNVTWQNFPDFGKLPETSILIFGNAEPELDPDRLKQGPTVSTCAKTVSHG